MRPQSSDSGSHAVVSATREYWPLFRVVVTQPPSRKVATQIRAALEGALTEGPHASIVVLEASGLPSPGLLLDQAEWFGEKRQALEANCRALAIVTSSAAMRGIPNALLRLVSTPMPIRAFGILEGAEVWATRHLTTH
jgi:hypothetical protein